MRRLTSRHSWWPRQLEKLPCWTSCEQRLVGNDNWRASWTQQLWNDRVFNSWRSKERGWQNCHLHLFYDTEGFCLRSKGIQEGWTYLRNLKSAGAGHPHVLKDKPVGKTTSLAAQRALSGAQMKKNEFITFGRRGKQLRRATRTLWGYAGRKLEELKPKQNLI